jgi:glycosyltransferase involved in cell wall biosynthesis
MKIAILSVFPPYRGGICQFNERLSQVLGQEHELLLVNFKRQYPDILFPGKTQLEPEGRSIAQTAMLDTINPLSWGKTARYINRWQPDVLITRYWMSFFAPSLGFTTRRIKAKTKLAILDNVVPHEPKLWDKPLTRYFLNSFDKYGVMSRSVANDLLHFVPNAEYFFKPHPLYDHFGELLPKEIAKQSLGLDPNKKTILFFGFIREYKGLDILIDAFAQLEGPYQLLIAGEFYGNEMRYQSMIANHPKTQDIILHSNYIPESEVGKYFSASDLCVLPYRSATQSGITAISYHFNVPVVATKVGGLEEYIRQGETGLLVEKAEPKLIATAIAKYFSELNPSECAQHIHALKKELSWEAFSRALVDFVK